MTKICTVVLFVDTCTIPFVCIDSALPVTTNYLVNCMHLLSIVPIIASQFRNQHTQLRSYLRRL